MVGWRLQWCMGEFSHVSVGLLTVANPVSPISMVSVPLIRAEESSGCFYIVLRVRQSLWGDRKVCIWQRNVAPLRVNVPFPCGYTLGKQLIRKWIYIRSTNPGTTVGEVTLPIRRSRQRSIIVQCAQPKSILNTDHPCLRSGFGI